MASTIFMAFLTGAARRGGAGCLAGARALRKMGRDTRGATAVEYGFVASLIVIAIIVSITSFGQANMDVWTNVADKVVNAK